MAKRKTVDIDGKTFEIVKFSPSQGLPLLARLQGAIGGSIFKLAKQGGTDDEKMDMIAQAIDTICERLPPEKLQALIVDMVCSGCVVHNKHRIEHIDDLSEGEEDESDPYYISLILFREIVQFSFGSFVKKLMQNLGG